jgi:hypothetical protein
VVIVIFLHLNEEVATRSSSNCYRENDVVNEMFATAEKRGGEMVTVEFKPGGADISVTEANKCRCDGRVSNFEACQGSA